MTLVKGLLVIVCLLSVLAEGTTGTRSSFASDDGDANDWIFDRFLRDWNRNTDEGEQARNDFWKNPDEDEHEHTQDSIVLVQKDQEKLNEYIRNMLLHRNLAPLSRKQPPVEDDDVTARKRSDDGAWVWVPAQGMIFVSGEVQTNDNSPGTKAMRYGR